MLASSGWSTPWSANSRMLGPRRKLRERLTKGPAASLTLPAISLAVPSTLSLVLDFMFFDFLLTKTCRRTRGHRGCVACQKRLGCGLPCCSLSRKYKRKFEGVLWGVTRSTPLPHGPVLPLLSF